MPNQSNSQIFKVIIYEWKVLNRDLRCCMAVMYDRDYIENTF